MRAFLLLVPAVVYSGCLARVQLPDPPSKDAPLAERQRAQQSFVGYPTHDPVLLDGMKTKGPPYLRLANGIRVEDPRDLLPWVEPDSSTAAFATSFEISQSRSSVFAAAGAVAPVLGVAPLIGVVLVPVFNANPPQGVDVLPFVVAAGTCTLIGMGFILASLAFNYGASVELANAFAAYPRDLAQRLALAEKAP